MNWTKIKSSCQSGRKVATHDSKSDLPLVEPSVVYPLRLSHLLLIILSKQSMMGLPDASWHLRYFEYSYLFYIAFTFSIVAFYVLVYCLKVPTRRFTNLKEILENDPVLNSYRFVAFSVNFQKLYTFTTRHAQFFQKNCMFLGASM